MAEADLRHVNVLWASPDQNDARRVESGELKRSAPVRPSLRKRTRLGPFKPRRAGGYVTTAHA